MRPGNPIQWIRQCFPSETSPEIPSETRFCTTSGFFSGISSRMTSGISLDFTFQWFLLELIQEFRSTFCRDLFRISLAVSAGICSNILRELLQDIFNGIIQGFIQRRPFWNSSRVCSRIPHSIHSWIFPDISIWKHLAILLGFFAGIISGISSSDLKEILNDFLVNPLEISPAVRSDNFSIISSQIAFRNSSCEILRTPSTMIASGIPPGILSEIHQRYLQGFFCSFCRVS